MTTKETPPEERGAATAQGAGRQLHATLSNDAASDFIMGAVIIALRVACDRLNIELPAWLAEPAGDDGASLTALFGRVPRGFDFTLEPPRPADELGSFAHHLAEVLRIARTHPAITPRFYNGLADAWCDFENSINHSGVVTESEEYIRLTLSTAAARPAEGEGGEVAG